MLKTNTTDEKHLSTSLLFLGGAIFVIGQLCPLFVPVVALSSLSTSWKTAFSGFLVLGIPELFMLASIAIVGQTGLKYIKEKLFAPTKLLIP